MAKVVQFPKKAKLRNHFFEVKFTIGTMATTPEAALAFIEPLLKPHLDEISALDASIVYEGICEN